jgi:hypothetical protein
MLINPEMPFDSPSTAACRERDFDELSRVAERVERRR